MATTALSCSATTQLYIQAANPYATGLYESQSPDLVSDNFTIPGGGTIDSVSWEGALYAPSSYGISFFLITISADASGAPGSILSTNIIGNVNAADLNIAYGPYEYFYYGTGISPFHATAGTPYWLSISAGTNSIWGWANSSAGDGKLFVGPTEEMGDTNFIFFGTPDPAVVPTTATPEPSSMMLLGSGILTMAAVARRRFLKM